MDDVVTVTDDSFKKATEMLVNRHKLIVEYSGAATTAALLSQAVDVEGLRVAVIVSGGNLDPMLLAGLA
jgi:threonine dehydratase